jgi:hypothetical protein
MTVVAIWLEPQEQTLWVVADTRISNPGQSGGTVVATDSGAKLFALRYTLLCSGYGFLRKEDSLSVIRRIRFCGRRPAGNNDVRHREYFFPKSRYGWVI